MAPNRRGDEVGREQIRFFRIAANIRTPRGGQGREEAN